MKSLSKIEQSNLLEIINDCVYCTTLTDLYLVTDKFRDMLQAENIVFLNSQAEFAKAPSVIKEINISYPTEWADIYRSQNFVEIDPITKCLNPGLVFWKSLYKKAPPDKDFFNEASRFGLANGFSHILTKQNNFGLLSIGDKSLGNTRRNQDIINYAAPHLHQAVSKIINQKQNINRSDLTPRERETLLWLSEGKTNWEISAILGVSELTIKDYVKAILKKINTTNRTHAVALALQSGLIK